MKLVFVLLVLSSVAQAKSHFDVLVERFQKAGPATFADLDGAAYTGRCFIGDAAQYSEGGPIFWMSPDDAFGGFIVGKSAVRTRDDAGPDFPTMKKLYIQAGFSLMHHPEFFEDATLANALSNLDPNDSYLVPASIRSGDLTFGFLPGDGGNTSNVVRKSGSTLYMIQTSGIDRTACYYFNKLKN